MEPRRHSSPAVNRESKPIRENGVEAVEADRGLGRTRFGSRKAPLTPPLFMLLVFERVCALKPQH